MCQLSPVTFHGDTIFCIDYQNQPYTPAKPIVENLGLGWASQSQKLNANKERWGITIIVIPSESGDQQTLCLPVRKLPAYLASINPKKVRPELRAKIELYQAESDDALWNYWMNGRAEHAISETSPISKRSDPERKALTTIINTWVGMAPIHYASARAQVNAHFGVASVDDLTVAQVKEAIRYVQGKIDALPAHLPLTLTPAPSQAVAPAAPALGQPVLSAELDRCMAEFEVLARSVEDMERLMVRVRRLASPITSAAARAMAGSGSIGRTRIEGLLEEYLDRSRKLAMELVPCARLGINVMRDLAQAQGR